MQRLKSLKSSLKKAVVISVIAGFIMAVVLSHMALAFYIALGEDAAAVEKYLDEEPEQSIRRGF